MYVLYKVTTNLDYIKEGSDRHSASLPMPFKYSSERYNRIYKEVIKIGFDKVHKMSDTMDEIIFQTM